jgi:hypothetical protein
MAHHLFRSAYAQRIHQLDDSHGWRRRLTRYSGPDGFKEPVHSAIRFCPEDGLFAGGAFQQPP